MSRYHALKKAGWTEHTPSNLVIDEVGKFWVVTAPTGESELLDILFERTVAEIGVQFKGGLNAADILGVFKDADRARQFASEQLANQRGHETA